MLLQDSTRAPNHMGPVLIVDPSTVPGGRFDYAYMLESIEKRLHLAPAFRRRLVTVPLGLDFALWANDAEFDLEFHVRQLALPRPGDWKQLCLQIARLMARPIDLSRPPWELYVIEGLDDIEGVPPGAVALYFKVHHAAIDGQAGVAMFGALASLKAGSPVPEPTEPWVPDAIPSQLSLLARSAVRIPTAQRAGLRMVGSVVPALPRIVGQILKTRGQNLGIPPATRFNGAVSAHRSFESVTTSLQKVKDIKNSVPGATVNDVALAIAGGAMRRYLGDKGELPEATLVAAVPISTRTEAHADTGGNSISGTKVELRTDIADDRERLAAIAAATANIREIKHGVSFDQMAALCEVMPGSLLGLGLRSGMLLAARAHVPLAVNTTVTNVAGLRIPLFMMDAHVLKSLATGPILDGIGLMHLIASYCDTLTISVVSCRDMLPDPTFYADCIRDTLEELSQF